MEKPDNTDSSGIEDKYQALLGLIPDMIFIFDSDVRYVGYHGGKDAPTYVPPEMFLGKRIEEVLPEPVASNARVVVEEVLKTGKMQTYSYQLTIDNKPQFFESRMVRYGTSKVLAIVRDVTSRTNAENALKESEEKYYNLYNLMRLMADTIPDMVWAKDLNQNYIFANKAFCSTILNARDTDEPVGKNDMFFAKRERESHPENPEWHTFGELCMNSDLDTLRELKEMQFDEYGNVKGKFIFLDVHKSPLYDKNGKLIGVVGSGRDITEKKKMEEHLSLSEKTYRGIINSISEAVYVQDADGSFLDVNKACEKYFGYPREYFIGKKPDDLSAPGKNDMEMVAACIQKAYNGQPQIFEFWGRRSDGFIFPKEVSLTPGEYFGRKVVIAVSRDITEQKNWEAELIAAREKAEESDRLKSAFLANMSHEIRTPMNGILGFAQLLKNPRLSEEEVREYLDVIEQSGQRMLDIINNLINISKIESGEVQVNLSQCDVNEQLQYALNFFKPDADSKGLKFFLEYQLPDEQATVTTDPLKLQVILSNLVKNAIKYCDNGSVAFGCKLKEEYLEFYVRDTGIGIPPLTIGKIFERFVQANTNYSGRYEGAGLGLAIAKSYVELLGGSIWVESEVGKGSTFHFTIPVRPAARKQQSYSNALNQDKNDSVSQPFSKKLKILIAEDDVPSGILLKNQLRDIAGEIISARNGADAVSMFLSNPDTDLILMDIKMPEMDGYEATKKIREVSSNVVIIAETAYAMTNDREKALSVGCNDYISKPINREKLLELVKKHFELD
ncbi:MAG TPA: PAS domain S-box protein [Tenuifilaceae bacterium]|nr:PAS domain S-box protein [Tenuifilaceae bacterium]